MIHGHECCAEVVEVGSLVKDFKPGDRVLVPAITPDGTLSKHSRILHALRRNAGRMEILQLQRRCLPLNSSMSMTQMETLALLRPTSIR